MATGKYFPPSSCKVKAIIPDSDYVYNEYELKLSPEAATTAAPMVAAIFLLGHGGSIHLSNLTNNPRVVIKYIVDDLQDRWAGIKSYWRLSEDVVFLTSNQADTVYQDASVTMVVVASPRLTHKDIVVRSLKTKKHVYCEKPISENIEDTENCYAIATEAGMTLYAAFNSRRFDPAYRTLKNRVRAGEIGHVQIMRVTARDSPLPSVEFLKTSGGVFHDCLVHDIDMSTWVLGELPIKVQATASALIPEIKAIDDFDTISFLLTFPSGTIANGDNSRFSSYGYDQRLEALGAKGMIKVENERPCHSTEFEYGQEGVVHNPIYYSYPSRHRLAYKYEMEHFLDVVQYGVEPEVQRWHTLAASTIATAMEKSARTGETVHLDWSKHNIPAVYY